MPPLDKDDINVAVSSSLLGVKVKRKCAENLDSTLSYSDQRLVFSRIIGHKTFTNHNSWIRRDKVDSLGKPVDIRTELSTELQNEIKLGFRKPDDLFWEMSQECWICEMWNYYMPIISKLDIAESYGGLSHTLRQLNEV